MPRPQALTRALAVAAACLAPVGLAAVATADPIISSQDSPNSPDSPTKDGAKAGSDDADGAAAGGGAAGASGAKPAAGVFPENDGALHTSVQANDPMTPAKEVKPIIPAGS